MSDLVDELRHHRDALYRNGGQTLSGRLTVEAFDRAIHVVENHEASVRSKEVDLVRLRVHMALDRVGIELGRAIEAIPPFNSPHEGWAVIGEELDELWAEVKANRGTSDGARDEAVQVAAMAVRYIVDLTRGDEPRVEEPT